MGCRRNRSNDYARTNERREIERLTVFRTSRLPLMCAEHALCRASSPGRGTFYCQTTTPRSTSRPRSVFPMVQVMQTVLAALVVAICGGLWHMYNRVQGHAERILQMQKDL